MTTDVMTDVMTDVAKALPSPMDDDWYDARTLYTAEFDGCLDESFREDSPDRVVMELLDYAPTAVCDTFSGWLRADGERIREYVESTIRSDDAVGVWKKRFADTCPLEFVDDFARHTVRIIPIVLDRDTGRWVPKEVE